MKFQLLYKSLHDILAGFNQEEKFIHNIRKTINNIVNYYHRNIVIVNINGVHMPFYMSTGLGGKENV